MPNVMLLVHSLPVAQVGEGARDSFKFVNMRGDKNAKMLSYIS